MINKLSKTILTFLLDEAKPRHKVTNKIKNYPKPEREAAIKEVLENKLVALYELDTDTGGRKPVMIKLTKKGLDAASMINNEPTDKTIWSV